MITDPIYRAQMLALKGHARQKYGKQPYMTHLMHVCAVLRSFGFRDETIQVVAWLHDILEDTGTPEGVLLEGFGEDVLQAVKCLTNIRPTSSFDSREAKIRTYTRISESLTATIVKHADRLSNIECSLRDNNITMIRKYLLDEAFWEILCSPSTSTKSGMENMLQQYKKVMIVVMNSWNKKAMTENCTIV